MVLQGKRRVMRVSTSIISVLVGLGASAGSVACSAAPAADPVTAPEPQSSAPQQKSESKAPEETAEAPQTPAEAKPEEPVAPPERFAGAVFPPADPGAPHERSKKDGDGVWRMVFEESPEGELKKRAEDSTSPEYGKDVARRMVLHPHEASKFQKFTIAAFDLRALKLAHRPGAQDVKDVKHPELEPKSGLVPEEERGDLFAVFNGGFQPRHGRWGMLSLGEQLIPARDDACTVGVTDEGELRIGMWPSMKDDSSILAYRQTPPCLVVDGAMHPKLAKGDRKPWAGQNEKRKTRRRSAIGVSKDGRTLFYALGTETEPETLAAGLVHAGAHQAAQLDINWNWTRLFFFGPSEGEEGNNEESIVKPVGALEKDMAKDKGEYIYRPGRRGFFYLVRRSSD